MVTILLLTGAEGVGKSTLARELVDTHGFEELTFAAGVRHALIPLWAGFANMMSSYVELPTLTMNMTYDRELKEAPLNTLTLDDKQVSPRVLMQWLGTDIMRRHVCQDIWALALVGILRTRIASGINKFVISDLRFENELEVVRSMYPNARVVRIEHFDMSARALLREKALEGHISMQGWTRLPSDSVVYNDFTDDGCKEMTCLCLGLN